MDPVFWLLFGGVVLLIALLLGVVFATRAQRRRERLAEKRQTTADGLQELVRWIEEGHRRLPFWQDRIERRIVLQNRLTAMAQDVERLRAEMTRLSQENDLLRAERADLLETFTRLADLLERHQERSEPMHTHPTSFR